MSLTDADRRLVRLFTAIVLGRWADVVRVRESAGPGEPDRRWREAVLQVHVFAGFPRLVEAYAVLAAAGGLGAFEPGECGTSETSISADDRRAAEQRAGRELFEQIYAGDASRVRGMLAGYHADFAEWIEGHAYGRVLARPGLAADRRELLAVAALAALGQERQLASHVRGSLRLGATREELAATLAEVSDLIDAERLERAARVLQHFGDDAR